MPLTSLALTDVGPFDKIEFEFDPHVNVFVGPNNSGKTTALVALANILVDLSLMPTKLVRKSSEFRLAGFDESGSVGVQGPFPIAARPSPPFEDLMKAHQASGYRAFVPALRIGTDFRSSGPASSIEQLIGTGPAPDRAFCFRDAPIVQKIIELDYRSYRENRPEVRNVIDLSVALVSGITENFPIRFSGVGEDQRGLFPQFQTPDGVVPLSVLSQGTQSLIQWCAHFLIGYAEFYKFVAHFDERPATLIVDEIDAHLHPSWQRRILPALTRRFPSLQIICATHSPLTLAGLCAGQVHLLRRGEDGRITASRNSNDILGWTADEIYAGFLGVEPTDVVTGGKLERIHDLRAKAQRSEPEERELEQLRKELGQTLTGGSTAGQTEILAEQLRKSAEDAAGLRDESSATRRGDANGSDRRKPPANRAAKANAHRKARP